MYYVMKDRCLQMKRYIHLLCYEREMFVDEALYKYIML